MRRPFEVLFITCLLIQSVRGYATCNASQYASSSEGQVKRRLEMEPGPNFDT